MVDTPRHDGERCFCYVGDLLGQTAGLTDNLIGSFPKVPKAAVLPSRFEFEYGDNFLPVLHVYGNRNLVGRRWEVGAGRLGILQMLALGWTKFGRVDFYRHWRRAPSTGVPRHDIGKLLHRLMLQEQDLDNTQV